MFRVRDAPVRGLELGECVGESGDIVRVGDDGDGLSQCVGYSDGLRVAVSHEYVRESERFVAVAFPVGQ